MKTSKAQQDETRLRIVRATVALITREGYDGVTMKDIAKAAGIGDATIYKYFPTKERLIVGYLDQVAAQAIQAARSSIAFDDYDLHAKLQRLTDAVLETLAPDRAFVAIARAMLGRAPFLLLGDQLQAKQWLKQEVIGYLDHAVATGEIPPSDFTRGLSGLYVDFCLGVIAYWMQDSSPDAAETTRVVDQALGLLVALLKAGLPDRLVHLAGYLLRSQLARVMSTTPEAAGQRAAMAAAAPPAAQRAARSTTVPAARRSRGGSQGSRKSAG
jgi:AcrR family transcriptional regulator